MAAARVEVMHRLTFFKPAILIICAIAIACANARGDAPASQPIEQTTVFRAGEGGYVMYRIPAALITARGTLLAFCEGRQSPRGPGNDSGKIDLLVKRSSDNGQTWSPQQVVCADGSNTCGNPCAVLDENTGTIWLLMTHNLGDDRESQIIAGAARGTRTVWLTSSDDDGATWMKPRDITSDVKRPEWAWYATGPGVGIQIKHGPHADRLVIPCDHVARGGGKDSANAHVIYSDDHGKTWALGGQSPEPGFNESQIVELADGRLMLNMRNWGAGKRADVPRQRGVCISDDGGQTFTSLHPDAALIEPICQASILRYTWPTEGRGRILFANPASADQRVAMTVRISYDEGGTWPVSKLIFKGLTGYSSIVALPNGQVGLLYEAGDGAPYERIDFARFKME